MPKKETCTNNEYSNTHQSTTPETLGRLFIASADNLPELQLKIGGGKQTYAILLFSQTTINELQLNYCQIRSLQIAQLFCMHSLISPFNQK